ncbi:hypothetical protein KUA24_54 [Vibrio phage HNL01]|nr:hypothetical protein KUA24_54 [Vibrio phage HNL01]
MYDIANIQFDPIKRGRTVVEAFGNLVSDLLGSYTVQGNPYTINISNLGTVTTYTMSFDSQDVTTGLITNNVISVDSLGTETTVDELYTYLCEQINLQAPSIYTNPVLNYADDTYKYFTLASREGFRILSAILVTNFTIGTDLVQASTGSPAAYLEMQKVPVAQYPNLTLSMGSYNDSENSNYDYGTVEMDLNDGLGLRFVPFYDSYITWQVTLRVESGDYQKVLSGEVPSAEVILGQIRRLMKQPNYRKDLMEEISGTWLDDFTITPSPIIDGLNTMSVATMRLQLSLIDRYIDTQGGLLMAVELKEGKFFNNDTQVMTTPTNTVSRPDYTP